MKRALIAITAVFAISATSCDTADVGHVCAGPSNCPEYRAFGHCPEGAPLEGTHEVYSMTSYVCKCPDGTTKMECCRGMTLPMVDEYHCLLGVSGHMTFKPDACNLGQGNLVGEFYGTNTCAEGVADFPYFGIGEYEIWQENGKQRLRVTSLEYGNGTMEGYAYAGYEEDHYILYFETDEGFPYMEVHMRRLGELNVCPAMAEPYAPYNAYGHCHANSACNSLLASCITKHKCGLLLKQKGYAAEHVGGWLDRELLYCEPVQPPQPDQW